MAIPAVSLYATSSTSVHTPLDFDINGRSPTQKPIAGGISRLFSSPSLKYTSSFTLDEIDVSTSFRYSAFNFCAKRDLSPVSVFLSRTCTPPIRFFKNGGDFSGSLSFGATNTQFIRRALGSCVNYDSPTFQVQHNSPQVDELTFTIDHNFDSPDYAKDLLLNAQMRHKIFRDDFVIRAFNEAEKAHRGQMRASGDPYLQHCVETAVLLALIGANSTVVAAGLLHDTLDDSFKTYDHIFGSFGAGVADLVEGVSKLSQLSKLARESNTASKTNEADRLHTIFLAMADARSVLIKLADRLHNMITLDALPLIKQQRFAKETLEIFAPLANRLGIFKWKEQLENLCFKHLNPDQYNELSSKLSRSYDEAKITCCADKLEQALKDGAISYYVLSGRHKSLYSIYRKMMKKKLTVDEVHDIYGLRLIVGNEDDCYEALGIVHQLWSVVPGKFKDYIKHPKCNGYQSLHTVVIGEDMVPLEVQIRTEEMHLQAEFGFAAHWRYKEGDCKCSSFVLQMVEWARWVVTWQCQTMENDQSANPCHDDKPACTSPTHSKDCPNGSKPCCGDNEPVFVILIENDKMSVQEFPANSTLADLLERAGRGSTRRTPCRFEVKEELWPKLNRELVNDPSCKLKMGDVVEITPTISDKSLTVYREEIQRMYDGGPVSSVAPATTGAAA